MDQLETHFILRRFEDRNAILFNETTGEIKWPIKKLPDNINPGEPVSLRLITPEIANQEHTEILKKVLEELVN